MYTKETLKPINAEFLNEHYQLTDIDVRIANNWVEQIESTRNPMIPMPGDRVRYTTRYGDYYGKAHIDRVNEDGTLYICECPYVPFCGKYGDDIFFSTSGGAWTSIPRNLKYVGKEKKLFCDWGHNGACGHGAIDFEAIVNVWEYAEPNPYHGDFSTKDWNKQFVRFRDEFNPLDSCTYHYFGDSMAFETELDYAAWLHTYKGVEFEGFWDNQTVVFTYRVCKHYISQDKWDALTLPTDTRMMNGSIMLVKYQYDDDKHTIHEYRYANSGELDWWTNKPYRVARQALEGKPILRKIRKMTAK